MNQTYLSSTKNTVFSLKPSKAIRLLLMVFVVFMFGSNMIAQSGPNCPTVCVGPGGSFSGNLTVTQNTFYSSITIKNNQTLTVKSGFTLYVGYVGTAASAQVVDFQNGCIVVIEQGASLVVNGLLNNSNNSDGVTFNGSVAVTGNVTAGTGSTVGGAGTLDTTGSINTDGSGSIFASTGGCASGPCSGSILICPGATNNISGNQTICSGNTPAALIGSNIDVVATYQWQKSTTSGANFIDISGATGYNYSPSSLNTTTYYRRKENFSGCVGTSSQVTILVVTTPIPTGSSNQSFCIGATIADLAATGTAIKWYATSTGGVALAITSAVVDGAKYYATQSISSCESVTRFVVTVKVNSSLTPATKIWNGVWTPAGIPLAGDNIEFKGDYNDLGNVTACSCTVNSGIVTISTGNNLILGSKLTVSGGSLTFEDDASLVQITYTGANSGAIIYNRETPAIFNTDFTYWSSPVAGYTLGQLSPNTLAGMFYSFDASIENWRQEYSTTTMNVGVGYIVRGPEPTGQLPSTQIPFSATFKGVPNNGTIPVAISYTKAVPDIGTSNLIGNPYPSALDANAFLSANSEFIEGTLYFWTHSTGRDYYGQYNNDDYASYNITGGVRTGNYVDGIEQAANRPSGKIAAGQAFFTTGIKKGSAIFNNSMRVLDNNNNNQFFKTKNPKGKTANTTEKNRIWLNLTNTQGAFKQTLIGYVTDATNDYDHLFDGQSFDGNEFVDFYSVNQDLNLVIQGRALPFDAADEVPLGYRTTIDGNFTINIDEVDGLLIDHAVFIEDKLTNTVFNLKTGNYTFSTAPGTFNDRFVLKYMDTSKTLGTENFNSLTNTVLVSNANKQIKINAFADTIDKVVIYDLLGRQIYQKTNVNSNEISISNLVSSRQVIIVKTLLQNGQEVSKKIVY